MSVATWIFRRNCKKSDQKRDAGLSTPKEIERFDNLPYGLDDRWQILDVYRPKNRLQKLPVIVSVHGGGWVYGDKEVYQYYCMDLAKRGFIVVNFTYRLAPKYKFPAALEDTNAVFHWIVQHAAEFDMDLGKLFAVGDSAGATNIGLYAAILTNKAYGDSFDFSLPDITIKALGCNCGVYTMTRENNNAFYAAIFKNKGTKEELKQMDLVSHITERFPPCYIIGASNDSLKEEIPKLTERLKKCHIPYRQRVYGDEKDHPLYHVFHCDIKTEDAKLANDEECDFFGEYMD